MLMQVTKPILLAYLAVGVAAKTCTDSDDSGDDSGGYHSGGDHGGHSGGKHSGGGHSGGKHSGGGHSGGDHGGHSGGGDSSGDHGGHSGGKHSGGHSGGDHGGHSGGGDSSGDHGGHSGGDHSGGGGGHSGGDHSGGGGHHSGGDHGKNVPDNSNAANNGNGILDMWRYDYVKKNSPFVFIADDGLPDFKFDTRKNTHMFNSTSIVCPENMQRGCCAVGGDGQRSDKCGTCSKESGRSCSGGLYCNASKGGKDGDNFSGIKGMPQSLIRSNNKKNPAPLRKRSRRGILERAMVWLAQHVPYMRHHDNECEVGQYFVEPCSSDAVDAPGLCPKFSYMGDCCGGVSAFTGVSEVQGHGNNREAINCADMKPGDFIAHHAQSGGVSHWTMFRDWVGKSADPKNRQKSAMFKIYQMGGGGGATNMHIHHGQNWCVLGKGIPKHSCLTCFRYPDLIDEDKAGVESKQHLHDEEQMYRADGVEDEEPHDRQPMREFNTNADNRSDENHHPEWTNKKFFKIQDTQTNFDGDDL